MKTFKLTKRMMKDLGHLLTKVGAVASVPGQERKQGFPSFVYVSKADYRKIRQAITKEFRKEYPLHRTRKIQSSVGMHLLDLGPAELDGVKDGYVLVNDVAIDKEIKLLDTRPDEMLEA